MGSEVINPNITWLYVNQVLFRTEMLTSQSCKSPFKKKRRKENTGGAVLPSVQNINTAAAAAAVCVLCPLGFQNGPAPASNHGWDLTCMLEDLFCCQVHNVAVSRMTKLTGLLARSFSRTLGCCRKSRNVWFLCWCLNISLKKTRMIYLGIFSLENVQEP